MLSKTKSSGGVGETRIGPRRRWGGAGLMVGGLSLAVLPLPGAGDAPPIFAIQGARVVPVAGAPVEDGVVVVRDGLIEAVGAAIPVPPDARIVDGKGLVVYPGLIDAGSDAGLASDPTTPAAPPPGTGGRRQGQVPAAGAPAGDPGLLNTFVRAADALEESGARVEACRQGGFTTVLAVPSRGLFAGQSAVLNLNGDRDTMVVRSPVAQHLSFTRTGGFGQYPGSLMGRLAFVRQTFLDARRHSEAWDIYRQNLRLFRRPETSRALEALRPVADRHLPLAVPANTVPEVQRALRLAEEQGVDLWLSGGAESGHAAAELKEKGVPVLLGLRWTERPRDPDPEDDEELEQLRRRVETAKSAGRLHAAGVEFAFASQGASPTDFLQNVRRAVRAGLPPDAALRHLTLDAARLLGVGEQLGSLEKGKIANLVVTDGDLLKDGTRVRMVYVDGRRFDPPSPVAPAGPQRPRGKHDDEKAR